MCQHYNTQNKTKVTQGRHESNSVNVLECLSQCSDLSPNPEFMAGLENFCSRFNRAFSFILNPRNSSLTKKEINKMSKISWSTLKLFQGLPGHLMVFRQSIFMDLTKFKQFCKEEKRESCRCYIYSKEQLHYFST